jgi:pilus assembly protein CpaE
MTTTNQPLNLIALESDHLAAMAIRSATADGQITLLGIVTDLATLMSAVSEKRPGVVLIDLARAGSDVAGTVRSVLAASPESCVVVTGADATPITISRAVSAGARGFMLRPFEAGDLANTIRDAHANLGELRRLQRGDLTPSRSRGTVITVYSPKGGVGCTTIATNLAVAIANRSKKRVAVVDLDLQFGDVGVALDLRSANSVIDLVAHDEQLDAGLVEDVFVKHESGIHVLVAPEHVATADTADPVRIVRAIEALRDHFAYIICDLSSGLDDLTLGMLRTADQVALVTTPELPSLKNIRRVIAASPLLGDERTQIVLNRYPGKAGVSIADVEKNLARRVTSTIPSEGIGVTDAINQGISMFDSRARVRASQSYMRLADALLRGEGPRQAGQIISAARA